MRINLFGGPGIGKSKVAAELYLKGSLELVREFVKPRAFSCSEIFGWEYVTTFGCQMKRELELLDYIDIVTDSPLVLQVFYAKRNGCTVWQELLTICEQFEHDHPSVNYLLERKWPYSDIGRFQNETDALNVDFEIKRFLEKNKINYETLSGSS